MNKVNVFSLKVFQHFNKHFKHFFGTKAIAVMMMTMMVEVMIMMMVVEVMVMMTMVMEVVVMTTIQFPERANWVLLL